MVIGIDSMGSICSSSKNNNNNATLPPKDLGELLEQAEKVKSTKRGSRKVGRCWCLDMDWIHGLMISKDSPDYRSINFGKTLIWSVQLPCCWWRSFLLSLISQTWWQSQKSHYLSWNVFVIESLIFLCSGGRFLSLAVRVWDVPGQVGSGEPCQGDQAEPTSASRKSRLPTQTSTAARISKPGSTCWRRKKHRLASPTPTLRCWGSYCS